jgi:GR25 family glycosyltransferase involved in LPS biosynthesis
MVTIIDAIKNYNVKVINIQNNKNDINNLNEINTKIKKIYVINLIDDEIKRNYIITLMKKYNINFTLVVVEKISIELYDSLRNSDTFISINELGCCLSHLWCLSQIIINNYDNAIIMEDDIILHKNFDKEFISIYNYCRADNKSLDFMLLGAHDYNFSEQNFKNVKNKVYRPETQPQNQNQTQTQTQTQPQNQNQNQNRHNHQPTLYGAHANYYSITGAKAIFKLRTTEISFFDNEYMLLFEHFNNSSYICYPNLAVANISISTLNHNNELMSANEYKYYNKCFINFNFNDYNFIYINLLERKILEEEPFSTTNETNKKNDANEKYQIFIEKCLHNKITNPKNRHIIKNRIVMNFFDLHDIKMILYRSET